MPILAFSNFFLFGTYLQNFTEYIFGGYLMCRIGNCTPIYAFKGYSWRLWAFLENIAVSVKEWGKIEM